MTRIEVPAEPPFRIWDHRDYYALYVITDSDGQVGVRGLSLAQAKHWIREQTAPGARAEPKP